MNEKNVEYLGNQLKYSGFGEELQQQLREKMKLQEPQFTLTFQKDFGNDKTAATLHFRKSSENDLYFFNSYSVMLTNKQHPDTIKQTFYVNSKEDNVTFKESYNLLSGRAVHKEMTPKEGEKYQAWLQLDFKETDDRGNFKVKQYHQNYNYNLSATLEKHPIKELQNEDERQRLIESLQRGNRQSVTLMFNGKEQKVFIEAVPQFKSLNFYESTGQRIRMDKQDNSREENRGVKQNEKQKSAPGKGDEDDTGEGVSNSKQRKPKHRIH